MVTRLRLVLACGLLLSLSACVESEHPISDVKNSEQDPRLYGLWTYSEPEGDTSYIVIGAEGSDPLDSSRTSVEPGLMRYWGISQNNQSHVVNKPDGAQFFCTKIGDDTFANWVTPDDENNKDRPTTYFFLKYRVDGDQLSVWLQDPEITAQAIEAGKLKGDVERKPKKAGETVGELQSVKARDTSENIKAFLAAGGAASCFPDKNKIVYQRVH